MTRASSMKYLLALALTLTLACAGTERPAYVAIGVTTAGVEQARQAYIAHANTCACIRSNEFRQVQAAYEKYQAAAQVVEDIVVSIKTSGVNNDSQLTTAHRAATAAAADLFRLVTLVLPPATTTQLKAEGVPLP